MAYALHEYLGGQIWLDADESHVTAAMARSEYEPRKLEAMRRLLGPGMTFVDVGANLGYFTLIAARLVGAYGCVAAFEPHPDNFAWLARSIEANGYENIYALRLAIGHPGLELTKLYLGEQSGQHTLVPDVRPGGAYIEVVQESLGDALARPGIRAVHMLKVDVEGAEDLVLAFTDWQGLTPESGLTLMLDLHPELGVHVETLCRYLRGVGFDAPENPDPNLHELIVRREVSRHARVS